jgi:hypothetical protein
MSATEILKPTDLKKVSNDAEMAKAREALAHMTAADEARKNFQEEFMKRDVRPNVGELLNQAMRRAAENGSSVLKVMEFPAEFLSDRGRAINNSEPDWPKTLQGWAERGYAYFEKELAAKGFHLRAEICEFDKDGRPGKVALYVTW